MAAKPLTGCALFQICHLIMLALCASTSCLDFYQSNAIWITVENNFLKKGKIFQKV